MYVYNIKVDLDKTKTFGQFQLLNWNNITIEASPNVRELGCYECEGSGRIYDPNDPRDIIEGNKLRRTITCPECKGTKRGTEKFWRQWYKTEYAKNLKRKKKNDKILALRKRIEKKIRGALTPSERKHVKVDLHVY